MLEADVGSVIPEGGIQGAPGPSSRSFSELVVFIPSSPLLLLDSPPFLYEASVSHRDKP